MKIYTFQNKDKIINSQIKNSAFYKNFYRSKKNISELIKLKPDLNNWFLEKLEFYAEKLKFYIIIFFFNIYFL